MEIGYFIFIFIIYLLPSFLAKGKENSVAIVFLNLFLGWTFFGWIAAFIWSCVSTKIVTNNNPYIQILLDRKRKLNF